MKRKSPRTWLSALFVICIAAVFITVTGWLLASPAEDISKAVAASGRKDARTAGADQFINAFSSVLVGVDEEETSSYVAAAKKLRPDLSQQITAAAAEVDNGPEDTNKDDAERVTRHRRRVRICCGYNHQLALPPREARLFLATHPNCRRGRCNILSTPPPQS